jgi:hypothetical protein
MTLRRAVVSRVSLESGEWKVAASGFEPLTATPQGDNQPRLTAIRKIPLAQTLAREIENDPALARVMMAWRALPEPIRRAVLALVES